MCLHQTHDMPPQRVHPSSFSAVYPLTEFVGLPPGIGQAEAVRERQGQAERQ